MIVSDGYSIEYIRKQNRIVIDLPQTFQTLTNTVAMVTNRKINIFDSELAIILSVVKAIVEVEHETD